MEFRNGPSIADKLKHLLKIYIYIHKKETGNIPRIFFFPAR